MTELCLWWAPIPGTAQEQFFDDDTPEANLLFTGGWGCVAGETIIDDIDRSAMSVAEMSACGHRPLVLAWTGGRFVPALASVPFLKGVAPLYRVLTASGKQITVTDRHRFLTPDGWRSLTDVQGGAVGLRLLISDVGHQPSSSGSVPSGSRRDVSDSRSRGADSRAGCSVGLHQRGGQLLSAIDSVRLRLPSQVDALGHNQPSSLAGGLVEAQARIRAYRGYARLSSGGSWRRTSCASDSQECRSDDRSVAPVRPALEALGGAEYPRNRLVVQRPSTSGCVRGMEEDRRRVSCVDSIISVEAVGEHDYYDLHVPVWENYLAHGFINHNSGKTMTATAKILKLSAINAPLPVLWIVPDWSHVKDTIIPTLEDIDPDTDQPWFLRAGEYHYHQTEHRLTWLEGRAVIQFQSAENPDSIAGPNMAAMGVDEPGSIKHKAWRNGVARVRHPRAVLRQKVAGGTPEGLGWLMDMFGDPERPESYKVYRMRTEENVEMLRHNPAYLDQVRENATDAEIASYLGGQFVNLTGALAYPMFDQELHWRPEVELLPGLPLRLTFDFNVDPMVCVACQIVPGPVGQEVRVVHTFALFGSTVDQTCDAVLEKWPKWPRGIIVYGDASGRNRSVNNLKGNYAIITDRLKGMGRIDLKVPTHNPPVRDRLNAVNRMLRDARGTTRLYVWKTGPGKLCPNRDVVKSLQKTRKKPGTDDIWKKPGETDSHAGDALGYLVATEFPIQKPVIKAGGMWVPELL